MNPSTENIHQYLTQSRDCAMQMMLNGAYILKELPSITMPDGLRKELESVCNGLIDTKHDLVNEVFSIQETLAAPSGCLAISERLEKLHSWIQSETTSFHGAVQSIQQAVAHGEAGGLLMLLFTESGFNIMSAVPALPDLPQMDGGADACDEQDAGECYAFNCEDSYPVGQLARSIHQLSERANLDGEACESLKVIAFAMERLPLITPGVNMSLALRLDQGGESDWIEIRIEQDEFSLGRGSWIDGDAHTETIFEVGAGYRDGDAFAASQFAESFAECARDVCREVVIEDYAHESFTGWSLQKESDRWLSLPSSFD